MSSKSEEIYFCSDFDENFFAYVSDDYKNNVNKMFSSLESPETHFYLVVSKIGAKLNFSVKKSHVPKT